MLLDASAYEDGDPRRIEALTRFAAIRRAAQDMAVPDAGGDQQARLVAQEGGIFADAEPPVSTMNLY